MCRISSNRCFSSHRGIWRKPGRKYWSQRPQRYCMGSMCRCVCLRRLVRSCITSLLGSMSTSDCSSVWSQLYPPSLNKGMDLPGSWIDPDLGISFWSRCPKVWIAFNVCYSGPFPTSGWFGPFRSPTYVASALDLSLTGLSGKFLVGERTCLTVRFRSPMS